MKIALVQLDIAWMDASENIRRAEQLLSDVGDADLVVLPEMWATGFCCSPVPETNVQSSRALEWMRLTAKNRNCAVCGTLAVCLSDSSVGDRHDVKWVNRFYFVTPQGETHHYDKVHLFAPGGENRCFTPGNERVVVEFRGVRFLLQTCFDLRFPESARNCLVDAYDVLLYSASWPESRIAAWTVLQQARAIENQALCIGVNRTGRDTSCQYNGQSSAFSADGECLVMPGSNACVRVVTFDKVSQDYCRAHFPVLG